MIEKIILRRSESSSKNTGNQIVYSWEDANEILSNMALTAPPKNNGYDKVDFKIIFIDGVTYSGRFDISKEHLFKTNLLEDHIKNRIKFLQDHETASEDLIAFSEAYIPA